MGLVRCGRLQEGNGHGKKLARWEVMAMAKSLRWEVMAMGWQRHLCSGIIALPHHRQPLATPYTADRPWAQTNSEMMFCSMVRRMTVMMSMVMMPMVMMPMVMMPMVTMPMAGLHKLRYPGIQDMSTWSKFGAHGEHGDVFLFSNLGALNSQRTQSDIHCIFV